MSQNLGISICMLSDMELGGDARHMPTKLITTRVSYRLRGPPKYLERFGMRKYIYISRIVAHGSQRILLLLSFYFICFCSELIFLHFQSASFFWEHVECITESSFLVQNFFELFILICANRHAVILGLKRGVFLDGSIQIKAAPP